MSPKKNNRCGIFPHRNLCCNTFINPATACLPWNSDWKIKKQWGWFLKQWIKFCFTPPKKTSHIHSLSWTCIEVKCLPCYHLLPASVLRHFLQNYNRSNENLSQQPWWTRMVVYMIWVLGFNFTRQAANLVIDWYWLLHGLFLYVQLVLSYNSLSPSRGRDLDSCMKARKKFSYHYPTIPYGHSSLPVSLFHIPRGKSSSKTLTENNTTPTHINQDIHILLLRNYGEWLHIEAKYIACASISVTDLFSISFTDLFLFFPFHFLCQCLCVSFIIINAVHNSSKNHNSSIQQRVETIKGTCYVLNFIISVPSYWSKHPCGANSFMYFPILKNNTNIFE